MPTPIIWAFFLGLAAVSGFAPFGFFPAAALSLSGLFFLWRRAESPRWAGAIGYAWGIGIFWWGVSWIYVSLRDVGGMAAPFSAAATLAFCAYLATFPWLAGYAFGRFLPKTPGVLAAAFFTAGIWTFSEWLRGWLFTGFPWLSMGYSQIPTGPFAGYAPVFGIYGVGFVLALIAAAIAFSFRSEPQRRGFQVDSDAARTVLKILAVTALAGIGWTFVRWTEPKGSPVRVAILQGNVPQIMKWNPDHLESSIEGYLRLARENPAELTVMPESAIPLPFGEIPEKTLSDLAGSGELLLGTFESIGFDEYGNGAALISDGKPVRRYLKRHLVPFGETVPTGFGWLYSFVRWPLWNFSRGNDGQPTMELAGGQRVTTNICYEDVFGNEIRRNMGDATILANLSNTAWFGDSLAQPQHLQISQSRAMETGRTVLRSGNTGISAIISPDGSVTARLPAFSQSGMTVRVQWYRGATPYLRFGDAGIMAIALLSILLPMAIARRHAAIKPVWP